MDTSLTSNPIDSSNVETFLSLCKELGKRINSMDNALLCYRAYVAYNAEHPETMQGKGNSSDRDASIPAFRNAAAKASGVAVGTIDALLQVGKAIGPLSDDVKDVLASCSLGNWTTGLRKLATSKFDEKRADIITTFAKEEKDDAEVALKNLKKTLGIKEKNQEENKVSVAGKAATPNQQAEKTTGEAEEPEPPAADDSFEMKVGPFHVRIVVRTGEKEQVEALLKKWASLEGVLTNWASANVPPPSSHELNGAIAPTA